MIIYVLLLFMILLLFPLQWKKRTLLNGTIVTINNKEYIHIISFILIIFLGLRGLSVGIDTKNYYDMFNDIKQLNLLQTLNVNFEHGYQLLEFFIGRIFGRFQFLLVFVAILYIGTVSYYIYKYSSNPMISYILFIGFGFYSFAMSSTRQTLAISFTMIAYKYIKEKNISKYLLFILIASTFHISALIFLPCYWLNKINLNRKKLLLILFLALALFAFKDSLRILLNNFARIVYQPTQTGGNRMYFLMVFSTILGVIYIKPFIQKNENNKYLFYMMVGSTLIMPITQFNPTIMRLNYYFFIFMIIYIPNLLSVIKDKFIRIIGTLGYSLVGIIWFFTSSISVQQLETYKFFWK